MCPWHEHLLGVGLRASPALSCLILTTAPFTGQRTEARRAISRLRGQGWQVVKRDASRSDSGALAFNKPVYCSAHPSQRWFIQPCFTPCLPVPLENHLQGTFLSWYYPSLTRTFCTINKGSFRTPRNDGRDAKEPRKTDRHGQTWKMPMCTLYIVFEINYVASFEKHSHSQSAELQSTVKGFCIYSP